MGIQAHRNRNAHSEDIETVMCDLLCIEWERRRETRSIFYLKKKLWKVKCISLLFSLAMELEKCLSAPLTTSRREIRRK